MNCAHRWRLSEKARNLLLDGIPGELTKDQRETLSIISDSSQRLNHLIGNLLDLSRMEADMVAYNFNPTDLNRLAFRSTEKVKFLADRKNIHMDIDLVSGKGQNSRSRRPANGTSFRKFSVECNKI